MLTQDQALAIAQKAIKFSSFPDCAVSVSDVENCFTRYANNGITTAGFTVQRTVSVSVGRDGKTGFSRTTELTDEALRRTVQRAEELAGIAPVNPEWLPSLAAQRYPDYDHWDDATARARSPEMIPQVRAVIDRAVARKVVAAGFFERAASASAFATKSGNSGYQRSTDARLTTTVRAADGSSSGWAGKPSVRITEIDGASLGDRALEKCLRWNKPVKLDPGKYTVVLEPTAAGELIQLLTFNFNARNAEEGRSFLSKKGGGTQAGEKLFPESITLRSDAADPRFPTARWSADQLPNRSVTWIEKGVVKNLAYDRYWAGKTGTSPTPMPGTLILEGGTASLDELIQSTERGLLVTRFWYIRSVNPQTVQVTGLTRDGLFLIENGKISKPVINLRFNESPVRLLQNVQRLGRPERIRGAEGNGLVTPPMVASDFLFTSLSDAV